MVSEKIINCIINSAKTESKDKLIKMLLENIQGGFNYNDDKVNHVLELLVDKSSYIGILDVNINYIKEHLELLMYNHENYNIKDIKISHIDNLNGDIIFSFSYLEKVNEDRADVTYTNTTRSVNYINNPEILKLS